MTPESRAWWFTVGRTWRAYQRWLRYVGRPDPPCSQCRYLRFDADASFGVRCTLGDTREQRGDFSCFDHFEIHG